MDDRFLLVQLRHTATFSDMQVSMHNAAGVGFGTLFGGLSAGLPPGVLGSGGVTTRGSCSVGLDVLTMTVFTAASLDVAVPCDAALLHLERSFQGMSLLQAGACPASFVGFDFALTDTLTIQVL